MENKEFVMEWLGRAKSNLERAKLGRASEDILYEDICFDCQQAAEKDNIHIVWNSKRSP